ncbi:phosphoribosyltransferase [Candidatus Woesearchaeota archaeon]|nr:phosphoribosyltransferase [Candidatus Woesearchaeota archaeon]
MNLIELYGLYDEQESVSYQRADSLVGLLLHSSPWVRKDAALALFGMGIESLTCRECDHDWQNERLRGPLNEMLGDLAYQLDEFYKGNGFKLGFDTSSLLPLPGHSSVKYDRGDYDYLEDMFPSGAFSSVLAVHSGGNEAAIVLATRLGLPVNFGYYQYREVVGAQRKFKVAFDVDYEGERVLVVDDFMKTGRNMSAAFAYLQSQGAEGMEGITFERVLNYELPFREVEDEGFLRYSHLLKDIDTE